ncbi:Anthranilate synthase alpha subunit 1, chloroplastic [Coccomyxa sp. Obi]|nr:Anthranilate synthase alpha subunit 1, chloroplastic [Coccomyxa sp. Obi]
MSGISVRLHRQRRNTLALRALAETTIAEDFDAAALEADLSSDSEYARFKEAAGRGNLVPLYERIFADQLTPVTAYRCLVAEDDREAPSFLFESVVNGTQTGRYSFVGAQPAMEVVARGHSVTVIDHTSQKRSTRTEEDPMEVAVRLSADWQPALTEGLPTVFTGGWVGYCGYDTVRYVYSGKLPFESAPKDDDGLLDLHLALYNNIIVFDHATKLAYCVTWVHMDAHAGVPEAYLAGKRTLAAMTERIAPCRTPSLPLGKATLSLARQPVPPSTSNMSKEQYLACVETVKEHIQAGDIFQLVLSHRFDRRTFADPFEVYRALRVVNPSPYMIYLQARGCILVASSPEILCHVSENRVVTNRPLAGTRRRGRTPEDDAALEVELLADEKECAEHVMLVDLGRNDVGKVSEAGSVKVEKLMEVERYSHVMHISSTVTGRLQPHLNAWDALRAALPAGTVSGAPKVRAMQIIDELEMSKRGPYGGGIGHVSFTGGMDMALALRTMVIPTAATDTLYDYGPDKGRREWVIHVQAGAGLVADSVPEAEYEETVNKAAALGRAIDLAEQAFLQAPAERRQEHFFS